MTMTTPKVLAAAACALTVLAAGTSARAQASDYLTGQIAPFGIRWGCPDGWLPADGRQLTVAQYTPLFSLYSNRFGGDGVTTFKLPDLRDRIPTGYSSSHALGAAFGATVTTLGYAQLPPHSHALQAAPATPSTPSPVGGALATYPAGQPIFAASSATPATTLNPLGVDPVGGGQPIGTQTPALAITWCVAVDGSYPPQPS
jgi:microcystin-dependent protein